MREYCASLAAKSFVHSAVLLAVDVGHGVQAPSWRSFSGKRTTSLFQWVIAVSPPNFTSVVYCCSGTDLAQNEVGGQWTPYDRIINRMSHRSSCAVLPFTSLARPCSRILYILKELTTDMLS